MKKLIKRLALCYYRFLNRIIKPNHKRIIFYSSVGRNIAGSPYAICKAFLEDVNENDTELVWVVANPQMQLPKEFGRCKRVVVNTPEYFMEMARAGVWVSDTRMPAYLEKRDNVIYVQTWHGTPLKKLALDMDRLSTKENKSIEIYKKEFQKNTSTWDCLISQNSYSTEIFRRCFDFHKDILEIGYPRNDCLFSDNNSKSISQLKARYQLPIDKKVILYAPTWRDDRFNADGFCGFYSDLDFDKMKKDLADDYVLLIKYHYLVKDKVDWSPYDGFIRAFSADTDINDLYLMSDLLVTDYSSVMFDYSILNRPMYFFVPDMQKYRDDLRGFYFDLFDCPPGPVSETTEGLCRDIRTEKYKDFVDNYKTFRNKFIEADDGQASKKVKEYIKKKVLLLQ